MSDNTPTIGSLTNLRVPHSTEEQEQAAARRDGPMDESALPAVKITIELDGERVELTRDHFDAAKRDDLAGLLAQLARLLPDLPEAWRVRWRGELVIGELRRVFALLRDLAALASTIEAAPLEATIRPGKARMTAGQ